MDDIRSAAEKIRRPVNFHLKIDTGMHRQGIQESQFEETVKLLESNKKIIPEGILTHLADPQENREFTLKQIEKWNYAADFFGKKFPSVKYFHASASGGLSIPKKLKPTS